MNHKQFNYYFRVYKNASIFDNVLHGMHYITIEVSDNIRLFNDDHANEFACELRKRFPESENFYVEIQKHVEEYTVLEYTVLD